MNPVMPPRKNTKGLGISTLKAVPEYGESSKELTRREMQNVSAAGNNAVVVEAIDSFIEVVGTTDISNPSADISPYEVDVLAKELVAVRKAKDVVEGRETALKGFATQVINMQLALDGSDPDSISGYLVSPENGVKLSKEVAGGKLNVDMDLLKKNLGEEVFGTVVNHIAIMKTTSYPDGRSVEETESFYELNEEELEKQIKIGNIGMEQILLSTIPGKTRSAFYVRKI
jgi:hypothetical protein